MDTGTLAVLWLACACITPVVARAKGRYGPFWLVLGLIAGPLALLCVLVLPRVVPEVRIAHHDDEKPAKG